jgi:hypothetical protein
VIRAALILSLAAGSAVAQDRTAALAALLDRVPAVVAQGPDGVATVQFGDMAVAAEMLTVWPPATPADPAVMMLPDDMYGAAFQYAAEWPQRLGFRPADIMATLDVQASPVRLHLLSLSPGSASGIPTALANNGYVAETLSGQPIWVRRDEDYSNDAANYDPADLFDYGFARASRIWLDGDLLVQSTGREPVGAVIDGAYSLLDRPDIAALVAALADEGAGDGAILKATLLLDPVALMPRPNLSLLESQDAMEQSAQDFQPIAEAYPFPGWGAGIIADIRSGTEISGVLVLAFETSDQARRAAEQMISRWSGVPSQNLAGTYLDIAGQAPVVTLADTSPPTVILRLSSPPDATEGFPRNPGLRVLNESLMLADMIFLPSPL